MIRLLIFLIAFTFTAEAQNNPKKRAPKDWQKQPWEEKVKLLEEFFAPDKNAINKIENALGSVSDLYNGKAFKVLVFYRCGGFTHTSIKTCNKALSMLGKKTGDFEVTFTDQTEDLFAKNLHEFDVLILNNTTRMQLSKYPEAQESILEFMAAGKGLVGIHAATDNFYDWKEGKELIGGTFNGHPWNANKTWAFQLETPDHPITAGFKGKGFLLQDEIYAYQPGSFSRDNSRVLISLDMENELNHEAKFNEKFVKQFGADPLKYDTPVSWLHEYSNGKVFYSTFGHRPQTFHQTAILEHYYRGILYTAGKLEADAIPSSKITAKIVKP